MPSVKIRKENVDMNGKDITPENIEMPEKPISQGRQYKRFSVDFMNIHGKVLFNTPIKILNISLGGVAFYSDKRLSIGGTYVLKLESKGEILHLKGIIIWTKLNEPTLEDKNMIQSYTIGMKFTHTSTFQERGITQFIQNNFKDYQRAETFSPGISGLRIHVRFLIDEPESAVINCAEQYRVKKIGQSGMLIESDNMMPVDDALPMEIILEENKPIVLWGRILSCQEINGTEPPRYEIGIEFIDISEKGNKILKELIASVEK